MTQYFWVNQKTYPEESKGSYLWAPKKDKGNRTPWHWQTMNKIKKGDIILNYYKQTIVSYCIALTEAYENPIPTNLDKENQWDRDGYMVDAEYVKLETPIYIPAVINELKDVFPNYHSPYSVEANRGNQIYLAEISQNLAHKILSISNQEYLNEFEEQSLDENILTSRLTTTKVRLIQGKYRRELIRRWRGKCAVSGSDEISILIASHIVPWRESNDFEKGDVNNGLLLSPTYDALFDKGLISFSDNGDILIQKELRKNMESLRITAKDKIIGLTKGNYKYLKRHRTKFGF
jgi:hypothetical protein